MNVLQVFRQIILALSLAVLACQSLASQAIAAEPNDQPSVSPSPTPSPSPSPIEAALERATIQRASPGDARQERPLAHLEILDLLPEVKEREDETGFFIVLKGRFTRQDDWKMLWKEGPIPSSSAGEFELPVSLEGAESKISLYAVSPTGDTETETLIVSYPALPERLAALNSEEEPKPRSPRSIEAGLGTTLISYAQTAISSFSGIALTAKASASYQLGTWDPSTGSNSPWIVGVSGYFTAIPLKADLNTTVRFLGLNARVGYALPWLSSPWRLTLDGGAYFAAMIVTQDRFGFLPISGPQISPSLERHLRRNRKISAYLKYSLIGGKMRLLNVFENRELAFGLSYSHPFQNGRLSYTIDFSSFAIHTQGLASETSATTLGAAYHF